MKGLEKQKKKTQKNKEVRISSKTKKRGFTVNKLTNNEKKNRMTTSTVRSLK